MTKYVVCGIVLIGVIALPIGCAGGCNGEGNRPPLEGQAVISQFVGAWKTDLTIKPARFDPNTKKSTVSEITTRVLKDKFVLAREINNADGVKMLWLITYDPKSNSYPFWMFNSVDLLGGEWMLAWDNNARKLNGKPTDLPNGWTGGGHDAFPDPSTIAWSAWIKDDQGRLTLNVEGKKARQSEEFGKKTLAAWNKLDRPPVPVPPEMKVLERLVGKWSGKIVSKPGLVSNVFRLPESVECKSVLDGRFLLETGKSSDGHESLALWTYDAQNKTYLAWWFNSDGHASKTEFSWDKDLKTFEGTSDLGNGITGRSKLRFVNEDTYEWSVIGEDKNGKVYVHLEGKHHAEKD